MRVFSIHHRLAGYTSHHFNEAQGLRREFERRGDEFILLVNTQAPAGIVAELGARAVLDDPTFRMEWSFEERSRRFRKMLHRHVDRRLKTGDRVLLTVSTQLEAHAMTLWLQELPRRKKPWIVIVFLSDRWNRLGREEYERQIAEFRTLHTAIASLPQEQAHSILFCALTGPLSEELSQLLGTKVIEVPMPLPLGDAQAANLTIPEPHLPRVAILGGTRREKGSHLILDVIRACRPLVPVEFLVQLTNNTLTAEESDALGRIADEPGVSVIREAMTPADYQAALRGADLALFPYEVINYRKRTSGVFAEAAALGKPVVATAGTWMAGEISAGRAAGTISEDLQPDSIARAIARCVAELESLQQALSAAWKKRDLSALVEFMEQEIALRARDERAPRRSWWSF